MQFSHTYNQTERGFTIVEVLIALTIFSIAVAGVITVAAQGGLTINIARNKLVATYLADEGIELVRGLRDTDVAGVPADSRSTGWASFVSGIAPCATSTSVSCDIDATNYAGATIFPNVANIVSCPVTGCPLYYDVSSGFYKDTWSAGVPPVSVFARKITVDPVPLSTDEVTVTVTVTWKDGITPMSLTHTEELFNWY
ncbi:MAG: prepilin-type N-terminal cleavage/methylation domain-containing protein [bacterium]